MSMEWKSTSCDYCGKDIHFPDDGRYPPKRHKECREAYLAEFQQKLCRKCKVTQVSYHPDWPEPPEYCSECVGDAESKEPLRSYEGQNLAVTGTFKRFGTRFTKSGARKETVLLCDVYDDNGDWLSGHIWTDKLTPFTNICPETGERFRVRGPVYKYEDSDGREKFSLRIRSAKREKHDDDQENDDS